MLVILTTGVDFFWGGIIENIVEVLSDAFHVHIYGIRRKGGAGYTTYLFPQGNA